MPRFMLSVIHKKVLLSAKKRNVFLDLHVKVLKNWRSNEAFMRRVGYKMPKEDDS